MENNNESTAPGFIRPRRIAPQNIVLRLFARESGMYRRGTESYVSRKFYQNIYPNLSVVNVEKPAGFLRKFSPDGKYLIGFSYDQTSVEIYRFLGVPAAANLLNLWNDDIVPNVNKHLPYFIRSQIFEKLFKLQKTVSVSQLNKQLNRECSLFTNDGRFVIVGAASFISDDNRPGFHEIYTTNEAITPTSKYNLEDFSIYLVDIQEGRVTDTVDFNVDKIFLAHNQGIYLYNNTFAVLSVFHQTIHIFEIYNGRFMAVQKIGRFCSEFEKNLYNATYPNPMFRPFMEKTINSLKHRVLVFLFKKATLDQRSSGEAFYLRKYFQFFDSYKSLRMWKMQLLDEDHLLIKYASEEVVSLKVLEPNSHPSFFVFYSIPDSRVLEVFDNTSRDLLHLFENFCDMFRNTQVQSDSLFPCSPSNNIYAKLLQQKCKQTIISARGGGAIEATKRMLAQLPISAQSYSCSPYLDLNLFSYDDKWISVMERPKACGEYPIRFFDRETGLFKFRIYPGLQDRRATSAPRRLVAFTFHPTEPFAISVQRVNNEYVVNFHIRHEPFRLNK